MKCLLCSVLMFAFGGLLGHLSKESPKIDHERSGLEAEATRSGIREVESRDLLSTYLLAWPELEFEAHWYVIQTLAPYPREVLKRLLAAQWVVEDGPSAMAFALTLDGEDRRVFLAEIFARDARLGLPHLTEIARHERALLDTAQKWLEHAGEGDSEAMLRLVKKHSLGEINSSLVAFANPERALAEAEEIEDSEVRVKAIEAICVAWYERESEAAWKYARDHLPPRSWSGVSFRMFDDWMRQDARAAFPYRNDLPMVGTDPTYWYERLGSHWPKASIDELLRVTREVPSGEARSSFVAGLTWYSRGQPETIDGCLDLLQLVSGEDEFNARSCLHARFKELQVEANGVEAGKAWAQSIADPLERRAVMRTLPNYEPDLEETMRLIQEGDDDLIPTRLFEDVVNSPAVTLPQLDEWMSNLPDAVKEDGLETVLSTLPPGEALEYVDRFLRDGPNWKHQRAAVIRRGFDDEEGDRSKWLDAALDPDTSKSSLGQLLRRWIAKDPLAAETWVKRQEDPAVEGTFLSLQVEACLRQPKQDWSALLEQAEALPSPESMRADIYRQWARADPEAALSAFGQSDDDVWRMKRIRTEAEQHRALVEAIRSLAD